MLRTSRIRHASRISGTVTRHPVAQHIGLVVHSESITRASKQIPESSRSKTVWLAPLILSQSGGSWSIPVRVTIHWHREVTETSPRRARCSKVRNGTDLRVSVVGTVRKSRLTGPLRSKLCERVVRRSVPDIWVHWRYHLRRVDCRRRRLPVGRALERENRDHVDRQRYQSFHRGHPDYRAFMQAAHNYPDVRILKEIGGLRSTPGQNLLPYERCWQSLRECTQPPGCAFDSEGAS